MKAKFVRFTIDGGYGKKTVQNGIISELSWMVENELILNHDCEFCEIFFNWLEEALPVPPFEVKKWPVDAVSWLKNDQAEIVGRFRDLSLLLEEYNRVVKVTYSNHPGMILYEDCFQVIAR